MVLLSNISLAYDLGQRIILLPVRQKHGKLNDNNVINTTCQMPHSQTSQAGKQL